MWKIGARSIKLSDYQTGTTITHGNSANPVLYTFLIRDNFSILRFEDPSDSSQIAATIDTQVPIEGYKRYAVTFPARADIGTYTAIVSEGQAEEFSFTSALIINRNNLAVDVQNSLGAGGVTPPPTSADTPAHERFKQDLTYSTIAQESWSAVNNHPNYRPYNFHRLAAAFWGEDQTSATITNYFDDITGVNFSLPLTGGVSSAHFGESTTWAQHPSYFMQTLSLSNSATGTHGGAELGTGDFRAWYSTILMFPSTGLTRIANAGPSNVLTNFSTAKRFEIETSGTNRLAFLEYSPANTRLSLTVNANVGNLSLYKNGTLVTANRVPTVITRQLNSTNTGILYYEWTTSLDTSDTLAFASSDSTFRMRLINAENTVRLGDFTRLSGGPFTNDYRRAVGFDFRLGSVTGNNSLLRAGNDSATITFGGLSLPRQTLLAYDELGTFVITGAEDGSPATSSPKEITYLHKTTQTIPLGICTIEASLSLIHI